LSPTIDTHMSTPCCPPSTHVDDTSYHSGSTASTGSTSVVVQDGGFCLVFPRNRINPPLLQSPVYILPATAAALLDTPTPSNVGNKTVRYCAQIVRIAPKRAFLPPHRDRAVVKLIRGETNEIPTTQAPSKAARSCKCPTYVPAIRSGSEGAIVLVTWYESEGDFNIVDGKAAFSTGCQLHSHNGATTTAPTAADDAQEPFHNPLSDISVAFTKSIEVGGATQDGEWFESTRDLVVVEGETYIGRIRFFGGASSPSVLSTSTSVVQTVPTLPISHRSPTTAGKFGEVGVVIGGPLGAHIQYEKLPQDALQRGATFANQYKSSIGTTATSAATESIGTSRLVKVPYGFEWGPFYEVDEHGHIVYIGANQSHLLYTPHTLIAQIPPTAPDAVLPTAAKVASNHDASTVLVASIRLPVGQSELAGPHRHCYT